MVDINKENPITQGKDSPTPQEGGTLAAEPQKASKGERYYNWIAYKGINYWANTLMTIVIADHLNHGKGRAGLDSTIRPVAKAVYSTGLFKRKQTAYKQSKVAIETLTMLSGGWLLLIPLKIMEDNKRSIVHWLNKKLGTAEHDAKGRELTADEIHLETEQPKQTWANVFMRRILASATVMGIGSVLDHTAADKSKKQTLTYQFMGKNYVEEVHLGGKQRVTNAVVKKVNDVTSAITSNNKIGSDPNSLVQRYMNIAVLDSVFTAITAAIMYVTNGSKRAKKLQEQKTNHTDKTVITEDVATPEPEKKFTQIIKPAQPVIQTNQQEPSFTDRILNTNDSLAQPTL